MNRALILSFITISFLTNEVWANPFQKSPVIPRDNPITPAKVELGRMLYLDGRLSKTGKISCHSCHDVQGSGTG